jgi:hypothetical protein
MPKPVAILPANLKFQYDVGGLCPSKMRMHFLRKRNNDANDTFAIAVLGRLGNDLGRIDVLQKPCLGCRWKSRA